MRHRRWLAIALAFAGAGCDRPRPVEARPALYLVADADTRIWLLGTVHLLPPGTRWATPAIERAVQAADVLVTELPPAAPTAMAAAFAQSARARGLPPLLMRVPLAERAAVTRLADRAGIALPVLDGMKSWAAALTLSAAAARLEAGATADDGVEAGIAARFAGKPHLGLETLTSQFAIFDALPEHEQRALIVAAVREGGSYRRLLDAWMRGDADALARAVAASAAGSPVLADTLIARRNARWSAWVARRMAQPGTVFVAVGAGHLAGAGSVPARLRAAGLAVRRVQ